VPDVIEHHHPHGRRSVLFGLFVVSGAATRRGHASPAVVAAWPERTVRLVTPAAPGSSTDLAARLYAGRLAAAWGRPVVVEGRPGADGTIAVETVLQQRDGHALLFGPAGVVTVTPLLADYLPFNPVADILPVSLGALDFLCVAVSPTLEGIGGLADLARAAAERPGALNVAAGLGGPTMALTAFLGSRGLRATYVPYRSPPEALADLAAGRLHALVGPLAPVLPLARDGRVRLVAVTNPERAPAVPEMRTALEQGFPELELEGTLGFFAPATMPEAVRRRIAADIAAAAADPGLVDRLRAAGVVAQGEAPGEFAQRVERQRTHWAAVAARHGVRPPS
jgi:tripartite-type tricarboxylate transporter receptor subunit TctC